MEITRIADLRPRFLWDIVDDAFDLYRQRFVTLLGVSAAVYVPFTLVNLLLMNLWLKPMRHGNDSSFGWLFFFIVFPLTVFPYFLQLCASSVVVESVFQHLPMPTVGACYRRIAHRLGDVLGAAFALAIVETAGILTLFIATFYAAVYWFFVPQAIIIEGKSVQSAFKRSAALAGSDRGRIVGLSLLLSALYFLLYLGMICLSYLFFALVPHGGADAVVRETQQGLVRQVFGSVVSLFLSPIGMVASTLLYYDLRVRREGIDLAAQAVESGVALAPDPFGEVTSERVLRQQRREAGRRRKKAAIR